jgi:mannan endo-1,4-beta-mannosidase
MRSRLRWSGVALALLMAAHALAAASTDPPPIFGVKYGNQGWDLQSVRALESWQGRPHEVLVLFTNWDRRREVQDNLFVRQLPVIWQHGAVPLITWEPFTGDKTPSDIVSRIGNGEYDTYVGDWGTRLREFVAGRDRRLDTPDDRRVYLRLGHEMNGNWYPWGQRSPAHFISMWKRVHAIFADLGLGPSHVQWMWCVTNADHGPFAAEAYYPGGDWVDWVSVDGYNWGASTRTSIWQTPEEVLGPMMSRVQALSSKPLALAEVASTSLTANGDNPGAKAEWITALFAWVRTRPVRMVCWYNVDRDAEFAVFGGVKGSDTHQVSGRTLQVYSAYRAAVQALGPAVSTDDRRLLTDQRFRGQ